MISLLYASKVTDYPILVANDTHRNFVKEQANKLGFNIPEPITLFEITGTGGFRPDKILIDDPDLMFGNILEGILPGVVAATLTYEDESSDATE